MIENDNIEIIIIIITTFQTILNNLFFFHSFLSNVELTGLSAVRGGSKHRARRTQ